MATTTLKTTREAFGLAINVAKEYVKKNPRKSQLAVWCEQFIDKNKTLYSKQEKEYKKLVNPILRPLELTKIELALCATVDCDKYKKDELIIKEDGQYCYTSANRVKLESAVCEANDQMEPIIEKFIAESIDVNIMPLTSKYPEDTDFGVLSALHGFVIEFKSLDGEKAK